MSSEMIGIIGLALLFILLFAGMHIGFALGLIGSLGLVLLFGFEGTMYQLGLVAYSSAGVYTFSVLPLFILMSEFAFISGLTKDAYDMAQSLLGRLPGGLAISTIGGCAVFATCTGSSLASAATMTKVALPEMMRYKYDPGLAAGSIAAGGTLGILIPPSIPMIIYALITETSVGMMFIAGVIPGLLLSALFMIVIYTIIKVRPDMGPPGSKASWGLFFAALKRVWPTLLLIIIVVGGIWGGVCSPTEAGGIGAFAAFIITLAKKKIKWRGLVKSLMETTLSTAMIFGILIGAMMFVYFMTASGLPVALSELISDLALPPLAVLSVILITWIFLGCVMDVNAITLVTVPIVFPITKALGFDPVWFGILFVITVEMAAVTPPIGMTVFVIAGMLEDIPVYTIFKGVLPFIIAMVIGMILIIIFPQIALFLPSIMIE